MKKNRVFSVIILAFLLIGFPLASWMYLQKGVDYRVDVLSLLTPKVKLPATFNRQNNIRVLYPENALQNRLAPIREHYANREDLLFAAFLDQDLTSALKDSLRLAIEACGNNFDLEESAFLVDTAGYILYTYGIPKDKELAALAEHVAFVLPPEEKKDILIKREREK